jgi:hypothetical protein
MHVQFSFKLETDRTPPKPGEADLTPFELNPALLRLPNALTLTGHRVFSFLNTFNFLRHCAICNIASSDEPGGSEPLPNHRTL